MSLNHYIKFYLTTFLPTGMSLEEMYAEELASTVSYYKRCGRDGFLSERMHLAEVPIHAMKAAKHRYNIDRSCSFSVMTVAIDPKTEDVQIAEIEKQPGFNRWLS